ncbi:MAG: hypothetical protein KDB00_18370 [Planctomycetales bacterium]|nr:hypothetical protein [Planctomycetales bacterium]
MRLTLRTLLAYLDDTLEPQDAELLRQKVEQSGFATQLVQRIRGSLKDSSLSAPAPDSVHPIEEPNMMSNYLDSTLSPEQIAEIEKACLESLPHLAEAAACHQILTLVLGRPAEVSDRLRERILAMVDKNGNIVESQIGPIAGRLGAGATSPIAGGIGPRFSGIELTDTSGVTIEPDDGVSDNQTEAPFAGGDAGGDWESEPAVLGSAAQGPGGVKPVGVDDSGVFQAVTKFREQSHQFADPATALDGSSVLDAEPSGRRVGRSDFVDGKSRASRVAPWLISLALVVVLIFAIFKIFAPLMGPKVAEKVDFASDAELIDSEVATDGDAVESNAGSSIAEDKLASIGEAEVVADEVIESAEVTPEMLPAPEPVAEVPEPSSAAELSESSLPEVATDLTPQKPTAESGVDVAPAIEIEMEDSDAPPLPPGVSDERIASLPESMSPEKTPMEAVKADDSEPEKIAASEPVKPDAAGNAVAIAKLVSDKALVAVRDGDADWTLLAVDSAVNANQAVVCAPEFRSEFALAGDDGRTQTLVGPTIVRWIQGDQSVNFEVDYGKGIVRLKVPGSSIQMMTGDWTMIAETESNDAVLAYDVIKGRTLGSDPMVPQNHTTTVVLTAVSGDFAITHSSGAAEIPAGSQVEINVNASGDAAATEATKPAQLPSWLDPEVDTGTLESEAASDLLELVRTDGSGSLALSLRVALGFRRNEVAALAGKTMLAMGDAAAYFGVDGLFSNPKQRLYWSSHLDAVRELVDRSVVDAAAVRTALAGQDGAMDVVDGDIMFRLLTGYTQDQLKTGGDAELVAALESGSLPVRVLAAEHLRDISGTTLFFRPEEEVVARREEVVKKWKVRLRKEAIRYPEAE